MNDLPISRRRLLTVTAAATALLPLAAYATGSGRRSEALPEMVRWTGRALGANSEIRLYHTDRAAANEAIAQSVAELERLERIFNLFHPDSALSQLNRAGRLDDPPLDLVRALEESNAMAEATDGAFDVTVQPLWALYADVLARTGLPPSEAELARVRPLIGWRQVEVSTDRIRLPQSGMALTFNGMGQGYITDRVAELLVRHGFPHVLVDLGELRAPAGLPDGSPWSVAVRNPDDWTRDLRRLSLADGGLATSEAYGSSFRPGGHDGHILDPERLRPALSVASVTVRAATATRADLLSTAIAVAGSARAQAILRAGGGESALLMDDRGRIATI